MKPMLIHLIGILIHLNISTLPGREYTSKRGHHIVIDPIVVVTFR